MTLTHAVLATFAIGAAPAVAQLPGFRPSAWFGEQVREEWVAEGVRAVATAAGAFDPARPTRLVVYATPNGHSVEQTLGCAKAAGLDWRSDIQHAAAQARRLREGLPGENVVLACIEADGLSWPAWKKRHADGPARVRRVVEALRAWVPGDKVRVTLAGHSGGGSYLLGYLDGGDAVPPEVECFVFLDANYSYSDADRHGDKLLAWLGGDPARRLVVTAYDDRNVMVDGKPVVGPAGGTFRATERMRARLAQDVELTETTAGDFTSRVGRVAAGGRVALHTHANPTTAILHTALVGEMNGLLRALTDQPPGGPRDNGRWVQPAPGIPPRPKDAPGGRAFLAQVATLTPAQREEAIAAELTRGNLPDFLRTFHKLTVRAKDAAGRDHAATVEVMPDYLAVGSDADFVRVPVTPQTAARVADAFGCALPTRKLVDEVYRAATVKPEPRPMTRDREAVATFLDHDAIIAGQLAGRKPGELVAGVKKDMVVTNRLAERPNRVAIYGWHKPDGTPIQPLNVAHVHWYVDYSHGVRLMKRAVIVDGVARDVRHVLYAADLAPLLSDEGPVTRPAY